MSKELLKVENLKIDFILPDNTVNAVRDVCFHLEENEILGIVGESGSGKTISCMSTIHLLPRQARITGKIILGETDILKKNEEWIRKNIRGKKISMIFQDPSVVLNPIYSIGWQMREALMFRKNRIRDRKKESKLNIDILEQLKITDPEEIINKYPHQLSGGMKQRIVIAIALLLQSEILIADEPTTSLDVTIQHEVVELISRIKRDFKMSVIFISHDLKLLADYCDRIVVMYGGMVLESGSTEKVYNNPRSPYTSALINCIPPLEGEKSSFEPIPGEIVDPINPPPGCPFEPRCKNKKRRCKVEVPELIQSDNGSFVSCFYPNRDMVQI